MAYTVPFAGYGILLQRSDAAGGSVYTTPGCNIGYVKEFTPPPITRETIDVTHHQSPNLWQEQIPNPVRVGEELTFTILHAPDNSTQAALLADFNINHIYGEAYTWRIIEEDGSTVLVEFPGFVTGISPTRDRDDAALSEITIAVAGEPDILNY